jgi:hypothetical protein
MSAVLACFGEAADPMVEGARLLELYQAQIVSTLRWGRLWLGNAAAARLLLAQHSS